MGVQTHRASEVDAVEERVDRRERPRGHLALRVRGDQPGGEIGYFVQRLAVYGRDGQACQACTTPIKMIVQSGRSSFYCPRCQR